ncbi:MAG TPA: helix-turn-helix domain-containing protein, partial [bacterium]|nr:helix-turn-helix domain-containing protein [bacterium]
RQAREALRLLAVQRVEAGESPEAVIQPLGFRRSSIYVWLAIYREHGLDGLRSKPISAVRPN